MRGRKASVAGRFGARDMRPINPDALGEKGERRFQELCADAQLFCNKVGRDRTGWDFIVEFPFSAESGEFPLDRRPQPLECRTQVKTVWTDTGRIKIRLSAAERLAKLLWPTFIFVLTVDNALNFEGMYCIHVMDDVLSQILMAIRKCEKNHNTRINKKFLSIDYLRMGKRIDINGGYVKRIVESSSGGDIKQYITRKNDQIANLGVIGTRYSGNFVLRANSERELVDVLLGVSKGKLDRFTLIETRFGIELPQYHSSVGGEILVTPTPRTGKLALRDKNSGEILKLEVEIIIPALPSNTLFNYRKVIIRNNFIEFTVESENCQLSFCSNVIIEDKPSLTDRISMNKVQRIMSSEASTFELRDRSGRSGKFNLIHKVSEDLRRSLSFECQILSEIKAIVDLAGGEEIHLSDAEINSQLGAIKFLHDIYTAPEGMTFNSLKIAPTGEWPDNLSEAEAVFVTSVVFGEQAIAFGGIAVLLISDEQDLKSVDIARLAPRELVIIDLKSYSFDEFTKDMQAETALNIILNVEAKGIARNY